MHPGYSSVSHTKHPSLTLSLSTLRCYTYSVFLNKLSVCVELFVTVLDNRSTQWTATAISHWLLLLHGHSSHFGSYNLKFTFCVHAKTVANSTFYLAILYFKPVASLGTVYIRECLKRFIGDNMLKYIFGCYMIL